jgi:uncharacterized membrane protein
MTMTREAAAKFLRRELKAMTDRERAVVDRLIERRSVSRNTNIEFDSQQTLGQRVADRVASFGGSWPFIFLFSAVLVVWVAANSLLLVRPFDPYPYILLNLFLSMLAAVQAPVIMMSQNRQAAKDRLDAAHDYDVNLKAELEIAGLNEKIDELRERRWAELVALQQRQIELLEDLLARTTSN